MTELTVRGHLQAALAGFPEETQGWEQPILNHIQAALELCGPPALSDELHAWLRDRGMLVALLTLKPAYRLRNGNWRNVLDYDWPAHERLRAEGNAIALRMETVSA